MIKMIGRMRGLPLLQLLALLLLLSCLVHPSGAVPAHIGSLSFESKDTSVLEDADQVTSRNERMMEEEISKMEIASNDYPGSVEGMESVSLAKVALWVFLYVGLCKRRTRKGSTFLVTLSSEGEKVAPKESLCCFSAFDCQIIAEAVTSRMA
ncbi:hypothetical protein OPV22_024633 [Ensete ventricosum]|uniref:Uncharacterized protein n=1 Tax=Ensete ventricosum TaxID=4639 RepID=A0AAV8Q7L0_ENSVE|nr:hypothetical protein OPV22_024633 [Ensete ventricosum]